MTCTIVGVETGRVTRLQVALALPAGTVSVAGIEDFAELPLTRVKLTTVLLVSG